MAKCGDCLHFPTCSHYVTPEETFPEAGGCSAFKNKGDFVEVVRCKDCKHSIWDEENEMWRCIESAEYDPNFGDYIGWTAYHNADYFCADGERREGE